MAGAQGLAFNEDKTKVVHVEEGFLFLGFSIRRYVNRQGGKLPRWVFGDPETGAYFTKFS